MRIGCWLLAVCLNLFIDTLLERGEGFSHRCIEGYHGRCTVDAGTWCTELETITSEGKGRGAVTVGIVNNQIGNLGNVDSHTLFALEVEELVGVRLLDMVEQFGELSAQERRDDGRRCLVATQTVLVGSRHDGRLEQSVVLMNSHQCLDNEGDEAQILLRRLAWSMQQYAIVGRETPVVVLTRTVDTVERLFVEQYTESVIASHFLHERHEQHVMVNSQITLLEDRS